MKNLNFFSNKLALVAIVAVSSIMLMSFQNAGSKKQSNCFAQVQTQTPDLAQTSGKMPMLTSKIVVAVSAHIVDCSVYLVMDPCSAGKVKTNTERRMSKF